jgi:hypothetical protein
MPPKQHIIPMITYGAGLWPMEGTTGSKEPPDRGPDECADDHSRAEDAPGTTRADGEAGGQDPGERQDEDDPQRERQELAAEALLDPSVAGAEHFGDGQGDEPTMTPPMAGLTQRGSARIRPNRSAMP